MKLILGITGQKQSGKDTVGEMLAGMILSSLNLKPIRLAFADALKEEIALATGGNVETINTNKHLQEVRRLLQFWGTEIRRAQDKQYWIKQLEAKVANAPNNSFIYVTDCRFLNEADCIRSMKGQILKVERPDKVNSDPHTSETEVTKIKFDHCIRNAGSMDDLKRECRWIRDFLIEKTTHK